MSELQTDLRTAAEDTKSQARWNYRAALAVLSVAVATSITASILAGIETVPRWLASAVAATPAAMLLISSVFRFEEKSAWYYRKHRKLARILRALRHENAAIPDISREFSKVEEEMEEDWVSFGNMSASRSNRDI